MLSNTKRKKETCVAKKAVVHRHERCILYVRARKKEEKGKRTQKKRRRITFTTSKAKHRKRATSKAHKAPLRQQETK